MVYGDSVCVEVADSCGCVGLFVVCCGGCWCCLIWYALRLSC